MLRSNHKSGTIFKTPKFWIIFLILAGIVALGFVSVRRAAKGSSDFDTFYYAGQAVLEGKGIYYTGEYYQGDKTHAPFLYPPFAAIIFAPLAFMPIKAAAFLWHLLCVGFFAGSFALGGRLLNGYPSPLASPSGRGWGEGFKLLGKEPIMLTVFLFLLALLTDNLTMAQVNLLVLLLTVCSLWFIVKKMSFWGGVVMAAAVAIKVTPIIFIPYFFVKRQWIALAGCVAGAVVFFVVLPALVFGGSQSMLFHRQWIGKSLKPSLIGIYSKVHPEDPHPFKKSVLEWRKIDLYNLLTPKNQSLAAVTMRLFLKDRNAYAHDGELPILVARRYEKLPVLFGGLPYETLKTTVGFFQMFLLFSMFALFCRRKGASREIRATELGLLFLSMTLFSPLARSHQFIFWMLPILLMVCAGRFPLPGRYTKALHAVLFVGFGLYVLQAFPYGKAAGMGMWANLVFWTALIVLELKLPLGFTPAGTDLNAAKPK